MVFGECGVGLEAGLTPTDVLHAMVELQLWDSRAARHAVEAFTYSWQVSPEAACRLYNEAVQQRLAERCWTLS